MKSPYAIDVTKDIKDAMEILMRPKKEVEYFLFLSRAQYEYFSKHLGENCGYSKEVKIIIKDEQPGYYF